MNVTLLAGDDAGRRPERRHAAVPQSEAERTAAKSAIRKCCISLFGHQIRCAQTDRQTDRKRKEGRTWGWRASLRVKRPQILRNMVPETGRFVGSCSSSRPSCRKTIWNAASWNCQLLHWCGFLPRIAFNLSEVHLQVTTQNLRDWLTLDTCWLWLRHSE